MWLCKEALRLENLLLRNVVLIYIWHEIVVSVPYAVANLYIKFGFNFA